MNLLSAMMFSTLNFTGTSYKTSPTGTITLPATASLNLTNNFTIEGWLYALNTTSSLPFQKTGADYQYQAEWGAFGLKFYMGTTSGFHALTVAAPVGEWFYFAYTLDMAAGTMILRVNNTTATKTGITGTHYTTTSTGKISASSSPFQGYYDEIRFWGTTRSQSDLTANKDSALIGDEAGLVGYYKMNGNANNSCITTGAANHGTASGGTWDPLIAPVSQS